MSTGRRSGLVFLLFIILALLLATVEVSAYSQISLGQGANDVVAFGVGHKVGAKLTMAVTS